MENKTAASEPTVGEREMSASTPVAADHPLRKAWDAYAATEEYRNSLHWALTIAPMIQNADPEAKRKAYSLMPIEQREEHVKGSLWAAFCAGFAAAFRVVVGDDDADAEVPQ